MVTGKTDNNTSLKININKGSKSETLHLCIEIENNTLRLALIDYKSKACLFVQDINGDQDVIVTALQQVNKLNNIRSVSACYISPMLTLFPKGMVDDENKKELFNFNFTEKEMTNIHYENIDEIGAQCLFGIDKNIEELIYSALPQTKFYSSAKNHISNIIRNSTDKNCQFFVHLYAKWMTITVLENKKLLFTNIFDIKADENIIYFIHYVLEQLKLNPENQSIIFSGDFENNVKRKNSIEKYIKHPISIDLPSNFKLDKESTIPLSSVYFTINQYSCVL